MCVCVSVCVHTTVSIINAFMCVWLDRNRKVLQLSTQFIVSLHFFLTRRSFLCHYSRVILCLLH